MKYLKTFELLNNEAKIGDKIICIDDSESFNYIKADYVYTIENIAKYTDINDQYKLENVYEWWDDSRFRKGTPEEIKDLETKMTANKYNL